MKKGQKKQDDNQSLTYDSMTDAQMDRLFIELSNTAYWQAILKFNMDIDINIVQNAFMLDPFKEPTKSARNQGERSGTHRLVNYTNQLLAKIKAKEEIRYNQE